MSQENVELVRRAYAAFERRDLDAVVADYSPEFEYLSAGVIPGHVGTYRGEEYKEFIVWLDEEFSDANSQIDPLIDGGDSVVACVTLSGRGRGSGIPAAFTFWQVWKCENGKIVRGEGFTDRAEALEAAGLRE